ncbi:MAG TPA: hypothetical protein VFP39_01940, partial [Gemmatimonadales bacterium]|nr:hypothetical protein [Gemmatimonadales bacterium]
MIPPAAIFAAAAVVPVGIIAAFTIVERRRREALQQYSEQRGYRFEAKRPGAEIGLSEAFPIFRKGHGHAWGCTVTGQVGG